MKASLRIYLLIINALFFAAFIYSWNGFIINQFIITIGWIIIAYLFNIVLLKIYRAILLMPLFFLLLFQFLFMYPLHML